jgi:hypothetical protein
MIGHKLLNKTKSATVAEPKLFHQLNKPCYICSRGNRSSMYPIPFHTVMATARKATEVIKGGGAAEKVVLKNFQ